MELTYAPGTAIGVGDASCRERRLREVWTSIPLTPVMAGGGLFDLDGRLSAVILPCGSRLVAVAVPSVDALIRAGSTDQSRLLARYGMQLDKLTPGEQRHFDLEHGTIVRELWRGYPAEMVGLEPGDLLVEVDGEPLQEAAIGELLLSASQEGFELRVRRGRDTLTIHLPPDGIAIAPPAPRDHDAGIVWAPEHDEGYPVGEVVAGSPAAAAGIRPGDRVLRLQHAAPASLAQVGRALAGGRPPGSAFVVVSRGDRLVGLLLEPQPESPA
jgi:S1-C subfamily serine protease